jgi:GalNAc5-diNAcBac-PP-undecaprenol beta-1,3-glucosyltransferase
VSSSGPVATVVVPTHDHGPTLRYSVASALRQTVADLEIVIIGDGMPEDAAEVAREVAAQDSRVRLLELPKGPRLGEAYRHAVLGEARGRHVFYLSDDDLWFPEHVETLSRLIEENDAHFVHTLPVALLGDGTWSKSNVDLSLPFHRDAMLGGFNRVGLTSAGHTLAAYRRLPHGWRTSPQGTPTDLHMWQQWLREPWVRCASSPIPTALHFPSVDRRGATAEERLEELAAHQPVLTDAGARRDWLTRLIADDFPRAAWLEAQWKEQEAWLADREEALRWHQEQLAASVAYAEGLAVALQEARAETSRLQARLSEAPEAAPRRLREA